MALGIAATLSLGSRGERCTSPSPSIALPCSDATQALCLKHFPDWERDVSLARKEFLAASCCGGLSPRRECWLDRWGTARFGGSAVDALAIALAMAVTAGPIFRPEEEK